jgi:hypothetical protein
VAYKRRRKKKALHSHQILPVYPAKEPKIDWPEKYWIPPPEHALTQARWLLGEIKR